MNFIKILGASGSKAKGMGTTSFQIFKDIIVDAGNVINSLGEKALDINHIFLTHSHADHISDLPFIIESYFEKRKTPLTIYALKETIDILDLIVKIDFLIFLLTSFLNNIKAKRN